MLNRYVKVVGHTNWFLVLDPSTNEPKNLSEDMREIMIRSELNTLHSPATPDKQDLRQRLIMLGASELNYEKIANKSGTILVRPSGSYMLLVHNEITEEKYDSHFPINEFGEVVICENDKNAEYSWVQYLKQRFPGKKIVTINFFDMKSNVEILEYFKHAEYITFSTTFTNIEWFEKLTELSESRHKIIGWCHDYTRWEYVNKINPGVEIVKSSTTHNNVPGESECNGIHCGWIGRQKELTIHPGFDGLPTITKCPKCKGENLYQCF